MQVSKPSLGKYLRRAVATRSWRLELEVTLERARRPISKKGAPRIGALSGRSWGKGAAQFASLRANAAPDRRGGQMPLLDGLAAVEERR